MPEPVPVGGVNRLTRSPYKNAFLYLRVALLVLGTVAMLFPMAWVLISSLKPLAQVFELPMRWLPSPVMWRNYVDVWGAAPFARFLANSVIVLVAQVIGHLLLATLAGYGFAKFHFRGKRYLFLVMLATTMLPIQVIMIPLFLVVKQMGWVNSYLGLIVPGMLNAFGIFFMRQYFSTVPSEYMEAARVDGAGELTVLVLIMLPLGIPALGSLGLLVGLGIWVEVLWPLFVACKQELMTMPVGLLYFKIQYTTPLHWLLAMSVIMSLPMLVAFLVAQREIIGTSAFSGIKQ